MRLSLIVPHTCRGLDEVRTGCATQTTDPGDLRALQNSWFRRRRPSRRRGWLDFAASLPLPCAATPSGGKGSPRRKTRPPQTRSRKVFVTKLAERNSLDREAIITDLPLYSFA
jgi:hypothetical protein